MAMPFAASERTRWFTEARFGLYTHWGLYSVLAGEYRGRRMDYIGEWIQSKFRIPNAEYARFAEQFDPTEFNADAWARLAREAGMRYLVYTAKHHEGFAMYRSKCDPYNIVDATPFGRDPLKELAAACARHGVRLCLYYSHDLDWHDPDGGGTQPDLPKNFGMSWGNDWDFPDHAGKDLRRFLDRKVKPQLQELLTEYGPIGVLWFDCPMTVTPEQAAEIRDWVLRFQPDCLISSRIGHGLGDIGCLGDNQIPAGHLPGVWETAGTINDTWGYKWFDENWKSTRDVLTTMVGLASNNVNYLLNIGPTPEGVMPEPAARVLTGLAGWFRCHGEAIHGAEPSPYAYPMPWGWMTQRPGRIYLLIDALPASGRLTLRGLRNRVVRASLLADADRVFPVEQTHVDGRDEVTLSIGAGVLQGLVPVAALDIEGEAEVAPEILQQGDATLLLPASLAELHRDGAPGPDGAEVSAEAAGARGLGPAGEDLSQSAIQLDLARILVNWFDTRDWVSWPVRIDAPGTYEVSLTTSAVAHSNPWRGGHRVMLRVGDQELEAEVVEHERIETPATRCYAQSVTRLGRVRIDAPGTYVAALRAAHIDPSGGFGLALVRLAFEPVA